MFPAYNGPLNRTASLRAGDNAILRDILVARSGSVKSEAVGSNPTPAAISKRTGALNAGSFA